MIEDPPVIKELYELISQAQNQRGMTVKVEVVKSEACLKIDLDCSEEWMDVFTLTENQAALLADALREGRFMAGWIDKDEPAKEKSPKTFTAEQVNTILEKQVEITRAAMATCDIEHGQSRIQNHEAAKFIARLVKSELK